MSISGKTQYQDGTDASFEDVDMSLDECNRSDMEVPGFHTAEEVEGQFGHMHS